MALASPKGARQVYIIPSMPWSLYIIKCRDESLYTGITTDISRRLNEHNTKKGAFYTQNKTPVKLVYQEAMANQSEARKREAAIKKLTRKQKLELVGMSSTPAYRMARHPDGIGRCLASCKMSRLLRESRN